MPSPRTAGLLAAAAGDGAVQLVLAQPGAGFDAALFSATNPANVFAAAPVQSVTTSSVVVNGLANGSEVFFALGIRATGASAWSPAGPTLRVRPGAPIFVDATANAAGADGRTAGSAFPDLRAALAAANVAGGGNVWVRDGDYRGAPYVLRDDVHVYGGFDATFALAARDPRGGRTRLLGSAGLQIVEIGSGGRDAILDGFLIDGGGTVLEGVDVVDSDVELRSLSVQNCADRGIRAKVTTPTPNRRLLATGLVSTGHGADGLSSAGPIDVWLHHGQFDANRQEGVDIDDLQAPSGGRVALRATGCRCHGNVLEGFDVDLAAPLTFAAAGAFAVWIENCDFDRNGRDGLLIDQEHEAAAGFTADIVVRGCIARGNRMAGVHVDADADATYLLERLRCGANAGDGVAITSETNAGTVVLQDCWLAGNLGAGARSSLGNKAIAASHCAFAGNAAGGLVAETVAATATSCVSWLQSAADANVVTSGGVRVTTAATPVFANAPVAFLAVQGLNQGTLTTAAPVSLPVGASADLADDDRPFAVRQVVGTSVILDGTPTGLPTPAGVFVYDSATVVDDLRLRPGSPALGTGITPAGVPAPDAGPLATPVGEVPVGGALPLHVRRLAPPAPFGLAPLEALVVTFDRALDATSVTQDRVVVRAGGVPVVVGIQVTGATITVLPPPTGWPATALLELHAGVRAVDGATSAAIAIPLRRR